MYTGLVIVRIFGLGDRVLAVGHMPETVFPEAQTDEIAARQLVEQFAPDGSVQDRVCLFFIRE